MLLTRLSAGRLNSGIIFRPRPDLPAEDASAHDDPANSVVELERLEMVSSSRAEVDLPANVRQQNNNS